MDQSASDEANAGAADLAPSYTGTDLDPALDVDFDFDDGDGEDQDLMRVVGMGVGVAAALGVLILLMSRRRRPKPGLAGVAERVAEQAQQSGKDLQKAVSNVDTEDVRALLKELRERTRKLHLDREMEAGLTAARGHARQAVRQAAQAADQVDTRDLQKRARRIGREVRSRADAVDTSDLQDMFDQYTNRVVEAINGLRGDLPGPARERLAEAAGVVDDNLPKARDAARTAGENLRDLLDRGRHEGARMARERGPQVRKAAGDAGDQAGKVGDILKVVALAVLERVLSDVLPAARKQGEAVADRAKEDTLPFMRHRAAAVADRLKDDTFPFVRHRAADAARVVREDVAPRARKMAEDAPDRVRDAVDTARPVVADAAQTAAEAARSAVDTGREQVGAAVQEGGARLGDAADTVREGVGTVREGVSTSVVSAGRRANTVVRETRKTTGYLTKESSGLLFWLAMLGGLIVFTFIPDRERQAEMWRAVQQVIHELTQMWRDFQGDEYPEDVDQEYTGDQA